MEKIKKFVPAILGVVLIGVGVFSYFRAGELVKVCTEKAVATVVDMREDIDTSSDEMRYMYYPIVSYEADGRTIEKELGSGSNTPTYRINDKIDILYNPAKVEEFIVAGENQNITWIIFGGVGILLLGAGIYTIVKK
ncbi:MAG: DUF3592 domain-containing protein [Selenomonadaceae bacterium]|nr:DUF3592 domain-containing protein [Selenomonadaceae bacterium]